MTVPSTARRAGPYTGNGSTTTFSFSFKTFAAGDLQVTRMDTLGIETTLVLNSDYSVSLNVDQDASPGGTITYPITGSPLPAGQKLTIVGDLEYEQTTDLLGGGSFNARVIEDTFDRTVIQIQQLEERLDRALLVPVNSTANVQLPNPEANELIGWDSTGSSLANYSLSQLATGIAYGTMRFDTFTGNGSQTQFALTEDPAALANLDVSIAGVTQVPGTDYTLTSATIVFTSAPPNGAAILARYGRALPVSGPIDSSAVTHVAAGTNAVPTTVQAKLRETVSVFDFMTPAQIADVQAGTLAVDCLSAFQAALASFPNTPGAYPGSYAGELRIPKGSYYLSNTWRIDRQVRIVGQSSPDGNALGSVRLYFADGVDGIVLEDYRTSTTGNFADGTSIERLYITRKNTALSTGDGIWMRTRARLRDVVLDQFGRHGCRIEATSGGSPEGNANLWQIDSCRFMRNGMDGLFIDGADANAGVAIRLDCSANGRHGIFDSSFLGNYFFGCHVDGNLAAGYKTDNLNNYSVFVACYEETGWTPSSFAGGTTVLGGPLSQPVDSGAMTFGNGTVSGFRSVKGNATLTVGRSQNVDDTALTFSSSPTDIWRLTRETGRWFLRWANFGPATPLSIYGDGTTVANGYARDLTQNGGIGFLNYYLGNAGEMKFRGVGSAAPTTGSWLVGDIIFDTAPTAGGTVGWVCVAAGTPGTWKTFGAISA